MASYNIYIRIFITGREAFFIELENIDFFMEYFRAIAKSGSDFA